MLVEAVSAGQGHAVLSVGLQTADVAHLRPAFFILLQSLCRVYNQGGGADLGEYFFLRIFAHEEGVGGADEAETNNSAGCQKLVEEDAFGGAGSHQLQHSSRRTSPHDCKGDHEEEGRIVEGLAEDGGVEGGGDDGKGREEDVARELSGEGEGGVGKGGEEVHGGWKYYTVCFSFIYAESIGKMYDQAPMIIWIRV